MIMSIQDYNIVARDAAGIGRAIEVLKRMKVDSEHPIEITIEAYKRTRSQAQNKLYWSWVKIISADLGDTTDGIHEELKRRFLKPILERDDETFRDTLSSLRAAYRDGHEALAVQLDAHIMQQASTSMMSTKQFTEFLEAIHAHALSVDINLPLPDDRKRL